MPVMPATDRPNTALLLLDDPPSGFGALVARARAARVPVVRLRPSRGDPFEDPDLARILSAHTVGHLVVAAAGGDARMRSTLHGAFVRGYDVTLVREAGSAEGAAAFVDAELIEFG